MPRNRFFFSFTSFFFRMHSSSLLLSCLSFCLFILVTLTSFLSGNKHSLAWPFLSLIPKIRICARSKNHVDRACLAPVLVNQLCVPAVTFPNREVEEKRVHRSSLFSFGQFGSALAKCKHGDFTLQSTFSFVSVCRPQVNVSWQTLFSLDIEHLKWKNVPCLCS